MVRVKRRTLVRVVPVFEAIVHGLHEVVEASHNLWEDGVCIPVNKTRKPLEPRMYLRHWTALRTAAFSWSGNLECMVRASCRSLSNAWK